MITSKIKRLDDDDNRSSKNRGSAADERAAMAALARKTGKSYWHVKTRARRPGRGTRGGTGPNAARPRHAHLKDYAGIASYLIEGHEKGKHPDGEGRVERYSAFGVPGVEDGVDLTRNQFDQVQTWMGESAAQNTRIKNSSILHYVVALPQEEKHKATPEFWNMVTERVMDVLDLSEHQALTVEHCDTDHPHQHIVINRVHPVTLKAASPFQDMVKLEALNHQIAKEHGLQKVKGRLIDPETGEPWTVDQIKAGERPPKRGPRAGANEFKKRAQAALKETKPFTVSDSWEELEDMLEEKGYHLEQRGGGLLLVETALPEKNEKGEKQFTALKVSAIAGKGLGQQKLEYFFGEKWADYQEAKAQGMSVEELALQRHAEEVKRQAKEQRKADQAATEKKEILRGRIDAVKGKAWISDMEGVDGTVRIENESEARDLIEAMTPQECLDTLGPTSAIGVELEEAGKWLEARQVEKMSHRLEDAVADHHRKGRYAEAQTPKQAPARTVIEPLTLNDDDLNSAIPENRRKAEIAVELFYKKIGSMTDGDLKVQLEAIRAAREEKFDRSTPQGAGRSAGLRAAERAVTKYMEKYGVDIPKKITVPVQAKTKSRGGGITN